MQDKHDADDGSKLAALIKKYDDDRGAFRSPEYNETQLRREFVDPLFEILGWDVSNSRSSPQAYKPVIHEDRIRVAGHSKAPDYSFRIGNTRKFFLEAKKPAVNLRLNAESAFQLRRYGWSAKLPISILTNFEDFAVYDCRFQPEEKQNPKHSRLLLFNYKEYQNKWSEISSLFSHAAVSAGSVDQLAVANSVPKGTALVDDAFLAEIERWRDLLARAVFSSNPQIESSQLNDAVQKTIDRIVFLRIAEDRGFESEGRLHRIAKGKSVYSGLTSYFQEADRRYNSGLFHFSPEDGSPETLDTSTLNLKVADAPLREIIQNLYPPQSPYAFAYIPADILGQVYERFLGRSIKVVGKNIEIEEKPDVKKAGGVFYTPTYVVRHIVRKTLEELLTNLSPEEAKGTRAGTSPLRIVDPACGSGSFLIEAYQYLLNWYLTKYSATPSKYSRGKSATIYQRTDKAYRLTIAERRDILTTHIFGVDIDAQAVEVSKLSLLLKVLEGEILDINANQGNLFKHRVLPDLGENVKFGNSIIGADFYGLFEERDFTKEEISKINAFSWTDEFPKAFRSGGFECVIGNPPYGAGLLSEEKNYILKTYPNQSYQAETYLIFLERAIGKLLKPNGMFGMIIPNPWLSNVLQTKVRNYVFQYTAMQEIVHFTFPVFTRAGATVDTEIVILRKSEVQGNMPTAYIVSDLGVDGEIDTHGTKAILQDQDLWRKIAAFPINIFLNASQRNLAEKVRCSGSPISTSFRITVGMKPYQVGKGKPKQTKQDVTNRVFDSKIDRGKLYRPYLRGGDIKRFIVAPLEERYIRYGIWLAEPRASAGFDEPVKILVRQTGDSLIAAVDHKRMLCMNNMHVLVPINSDCDILYFVALLNSKLLNWYYQSLNPEMGEALAEVKKINVERLPIPNASEADRKKIGKLAEEIATAIKTTRTASDESERRLNRRLLERKWSDLNAFVYRLFGLSKTEVAEVEEAQQNHGVE